MAASCIRLISVIKQLLVLLYVALHHRILGKKKPDDESGHKECV